MKILNSTQVSDADRLTTEKLGIPSLQLMENAAQAVVSRLGLEAADLKTKPRSFVVLCGKGNNGGDGLAIARILHRRGEGVRVVLVADPAALSSDAATQWQRWQDCGAPTVIVREASDWWPCRHLLSSATDVVDALLGVGIRGPAQGVMKIVIDDVNCLQPTHRYRVVAVDIPSGLPADGAMEEGSAIHAAQTVTFTAPKPGLLVGANLDFVGRLSVATIGTPDELLPDASLRWLEFSEFRELPLLRKRDGHKGDYGHVLVIAGSRGKAGAAALAGLGALHSGAGLVTVATPESSLLVVAGHAPELMTEPLPETDTGTISLRSLDYARMEKLQEGKTALAIGPGLGTHPETQELIRALVKNTKLPTILDADGLNAFAGRAGDLAFHQTGFLAITPHPGEMARLLACSNAQVQSRRIEVAQDAAARWKCAVILKGAGTVIAFDNVRAYLNTSGNPWMASGGSGDVLTGALAGHVAQFGTGLWEKSLCFSVYCHGRAGDLRLAEAGEAPVLASMLLGNLGKARHEVADDLLGNPNAEVVA